MKKIFLFPLCLLLLVNNHTTAQITFQKTYGGSDYEYGNWVQPTADGGYIITGFTGSFGAGLFDMYLIKTNNVGDTLWTRVLGNGGDERIESIIQTTDGGYAITGFDNYSAYLMKFNANGILQWKTKYEFSDSYGGFSLQQTLDGGFVFVCTVFVQNVSGIFLIKTDSSGNTTWIKSYQNLNELASRVRQTPDKGYIITGAVFSGGNYEVLLIKTDSVGEVSWTNPRSYGGAGDDIGNSVLSTADGGYIIAGSSNSFNDGGVYVIKTDASGFALWSKTYGGDYQFTYASCYSPISIENTSDGNYFVTGGSGDSIYVLKINTSGEVLWAKTYGMGSELSSFGQQTTDGGYIITGTTEYGVYLIKTDSLGNSGCYENDVTVTPGLPATISSGFIVNTSSPAAVLDTTDYSFVSGATTTTLCIATAVDKIPEHDPFQILNNPSDKSFTIKFNSPVRNYYVSIFNILGVRVYEEGVFHESELEIKLDNISSGIYFINVFDGGEEFTKRLIIAHN